MQRVPPFRGKLRVGAWLLRTEKNTRDVCVTDAQGNQFVMPDLREPMAQHVLWNGVYEPDGLQVLRAQLGPAACFVDVGANIGLFTVTAARMRRGGRVFAIEASPTLFAYLNMNIARNDLDNVTTWNAAASDRAGTARFYDAPPEKFGMGSLAPQFHQAGFDVETKTLDEMLGAEAACARVVKIDVEGFEAAVLCGATNLLEQSPLLVFEFCDWAEERAGVSCGAAQRELVARGYEIWRMGDWRHNAAPLSEIITRGSEMLVARRRRTK